MSGSLAAREELRAGLTRVLSDVPLRSGHVELGATWVSLEGASIYGEAVVHPVRNLGLFAGATWSPQRSRVTAVAGARYTFHW